MLLFAAWGNEKLQHTRRGESRYIDQFQKEYLQKEAAITQRLDDIAHTLKKEDSLSPADSDLNASYDQLHSDGLVILIYKNDSLKFWSDNLTIFNDRFSTAGFDKQLIFIGNGWYTVRSLKINRWNIAGLILIKHQYPYENQFLKNEFQEDFKLPPEVMLTNSPLEGMAHAAIHDLGGHRLFYLNFRKDLSFGNLSLPFAVILYFLLGIFLIVLFRHLVRIQKTRTARLTLIFIIAVAIALLRFAMIRLQVPEVLYNSDLFSPGHFATNRALPSLGDLLLSSVFIFFIIYLIHNDIAISPSRNKIRVSSFFLFNSYLILLIAVFLYLHFLFTSLVMNSDISFEARNVLDLSVYSFIGLGSMVLLFAAFGLLCHRFVVHFSFYYPFRTFLLTLLIWNILGLGILIGCKQYGALFGLGFYLLFMFLIGGVEYKHWFHYNFSFYILLILFFSLYSTFLTDKVNKRKELERSKVLVMNLATEHDPIAELMLDNITSDLRNDTIIPVKLKPADFHIDDLYSYLARRYFGGYLSRYDFQVTVCDPGDSVLVQPENHMVHCYSFFAELIKNSGIPLSDSGFYYLDNRNGRISYFGRFEYALEKRREPVAINIQLDSRPVSEEPGYPELLLDAKNIGNPMLKGYSYAKYYHGKLISQAGSYPYSLNNSSFAGKNEFSVVMSEGYHHLVYRLNPERMIVLSGPAITPFENVIAFSYIFVYYFLIVTLLLLITHFRLFEKGFQYSFMNRIQYSMIFLLLLALLLVGGGSIYFSVKQYRAKHREILAEKVQSVSVEMFHRFNREDKLTAAWSAPDFDNLDELLRKFSNVFYCDINLYDNNGVLLATSRPEIFSETLIGPRMNPVAYEQMKALMKAEFIHKEQIGSLTYLSAYVPFVNHQGKLLAYLNLPYFTRQNLLTVEVSNLIITFINIYLILILLSISLAVLLSKQITQPLRMIQNRLREVKLGNPYEHIAYKGEDEIAGLVREYNRMLEELERSAELLARSERESAWREMARQIAHEIKNPLTPMRLSVQHLQRAWEDKAPQFGDMLKRFATTLSEQIDNLSYIATSFSNFATLPKGKFREINLVDVIRGTMLLFEETGSSHVKFELNGISEAVIYADPEQVNRVLINLIKNALQAIPEGREGIIIFELTEVHDGFRIMVADNGEGISEELRGKMFQPNFTTKSAGMGLGLAITKRIVETMKGKIWFETQTGKGTQFYIFIPSWETTQNFFSKDSEKP